MLNAAKTIVRLRKNGIKHPIITYQEARRVGLPLSVLCAVLEQETAGGQNVFGHDPTIYVGAGAVTKKKYLAYKRERSRTGKMQGVGPMQLTWHGYQDQADAIGGCWNPRYNIRIGAKILHDSYRKTHDWTKTFTQYNGSSVYGRQVSERLNKWKRILK